MSKKNNFLNLNTETITLIRGLLIGKILTILVLGGLFWLWLKPRLEPYRNVTSTQSPDIASSVSSNFLTVTDVPPGSFKYSGSTAWAPIRLQIDSPLQNAHPEIQLHYVDPVDSSPGSGSGIRMLLNGQLDFAQSSRPVTVDEQTVARQRGFTLEQRQVGIDGIAVVVNPSLHVPGLTLDQLQQIYLGKITNWSQLGGPNLAITPFAQYPKDGDSELFTQQKEINRQALGPNVHYVYSTTEALRLVNQNLGGVYYASARAVVPQCIVKPLPLGHNSSQLVAPYRTPLVPPEQCSHQRNRLNTEALKNGSYPLISKLYVIIKQNKGQEQKIAEAYANLLLTQQGQKAIEQAGFVPIR
ncbi:MAG: substrate-binding domain-containing protein [Chroococcidiopsidaceae cyanobacterium CP_BM_ER_R8_30]|nr:substrate-binding domain-containing protein [Chroococcidiopsidaceae cyanobacterium CP_BM_ER_R8_30]